jgi:hypothetical protein
MHARAPRATREGKNFNTHFWAAYGNSSYSNDRLSGMEKQVCQQAVNKLCSHCLSQDVKFGINELSC